jgi:hypothetical protein
MKMSSRILPWLLVAGLPLFFTIHNWNEQFRYLSAADVAPLLLIYLAASTFVFFISKWIWKDGVRASLASTGAMAVFFFFGAIQDFFRDRLPGLPIHRYAVLLPIMAAILGFLFIRLRSNRGGWERPTRFLALLIFVLLVWEAARMLFAPQTPLDRQALPVRTTQPGKSPDSMPDIYYIVADEYSSTRSLKERFGYDNTRMDSTLASMGFHVLKDARSNYNFTPFSVASTLNMGYLDWLPDSVVRSPEDYNHCSLDISGNRVCSLLLAKGYQLRNYSIFNIQGSPSPVDETFLPLKTKLITGQTLFARMKKDLGHLLLAGPFEIGWLSRDLIYGAGRSTDTLLARTVREAGLKSNKPRFIYTHLYLPHPPFYVDGNGKQKDRSTLMKELDSIPDQAYLDYLPYANARILTLVNAIRKNQARPTVIILLSDHGFRGHGIPLAREQYFMNYAAVLLPSGDAAGFMDSMTNVNVFPTLLNSLFQDSIPMQPDRTVLLLDRNKGSGAVAHEP